MKTLIAEDDAVTSLQLEGLLTKWDHDVGWPVPTACRPGKPCRKSNCGPDDPATITPPLLL